MILQRSDRIVLAILALLLLVCLGVPRLLLWLDPEADNVTRFWADVMQDDLFFDEYEGTLWRDKNETPLPAGKLLQLSGVQQPPPVFEVTLAKDDPQARRLWEGIPDLVRVQRVAYLSDPALARDRWGRRWVLAFTRVELADGDWGWEGGGDFYSQGADGRFDWGGGDDHHVWGRWSGTISKRHWFPLFLVIAIPLALMQVAQRALSQSPGLDPVREGILATLTCLPVWGLLLLVKLGFPRLDQSPFLAPLGDLLWVRPSTSLFLTLGGIAWAVAFWRRLRQQALAQEPGQGGDEHHQPQ